MKTQYLKVGAAAFVALASALVSLPSRADYDGGAIVAIIASQQAAENLAAQDTALAKARWGTTPGTLVAGVMTGLAASSIVVNPVALGAVVALVSLTVAASPAFALVSSSTEPSTIISAALNLFLGPIGTGLATLGLIVMLLQITRFGIAGLLIYIGIISGIFGASYVVQQLLGTSV